MSKKPISLSNFRQIFPLYCKINKIGSKTHQGSCQASTMELFAKWSYFHKKLYHLCLLGSYASLQKQPFVNVLQNMCSKRFRNIHRKTPVLEFTKTRLRYSGFPVKFAKIFKNTYFEEHLLTTASVCNTPTYWTHKKNYNDYHLLPFIQKHPIPASINLFMKAIIALSAPTGMQDTPKNFFRKSV